MATKIIGISGRKQSGKSSLTKFLIKNADVLFPKSMEVQAFDGKRAHLKLDTEAKVFPMAGPLKKFCHEVLGLTHEQCYGSDLDKETLTRYKWEDMPMYEAYRFEAIEKVFRASLKGMIGHTPYSEYSEIIKESVKFTPSGFMTARQVLQGVGSEMGRRFHKNLWCEANTRAIQNSGADVALIDDIRFENEVGAVQAAGGIVIRLTRHLRNRTDPHISESALDGFTNFDKVMDNQNMSVSLTCQEVAKYLGGIGVVEKVRLEDLDYNEV